MHLAFVPLSGSPVVYLRTRHLYINDRCGMPTLTVSPLPAPPSFAASEVPEFGRVVAGFDPATASTDEYKQVEELLYKHSILVFRGLDVTPEVQYRLTKHFDPSAETYGHGNNKTGSEKKSILVRGRQQSEDGVICWRGCGLGLTRKPAAPASTAPGSQDHP